MEVEFPDPGSGSLRSLHKKVAEDAIVESEGAPAATGAVAPENEDDVGSDAATVLSAIGRGFSAGWVTSRAKVTYCSYNS